MKQQHWLKALKYANINKSLSSWFHQTQEAYNRLQKGESLDIKEKKQKKRKVLVGL